MGLPSIHQGGFVSNNPVYLTSLCAYEIHIMYICITLHTSKKSPTGPTERTPKPEYLIALATYLGVRW